VLKLSCSKRSYVLFSLVAVILNKLNDAYDDNDDEDPFFGHSAEVTLAISKNQT